MDTNRVARVVFINLGGAIIIDQDGNRHHLPCGDPDQNPFARLLKSIQANGQALEAAAAIEDIALRERMEQTLTELVLLQTERLNEAYAGR